MLAWSLLAFHLVALAGTAALLVTTLGVLLWYVTRRPQPLPQRPVSRARVGAPPPLPVGLVRRPAGTIPSIARASRLSGGALAVAAPSGPLACPSCRREFDAAVRFCPYDARRLVGIAELGWRRAGGMCPRCRRGFEAGLRYCPHDAQELIPLSVWEGTRGRARPALTGVLAKICPQCGARHDLASLFCTKDGADLVTIN